MNTLANWSWKDGTPPGPQTARAGETWIFRLPLVGTGSPPTIDWLDLPSGLNVTPASGDGLTFAFQIPADLSGIQRLRYQRPGAPDVDELLVKILPAESASVAKQSVHSQSANSQGAGLSIVGQRINPHAESTTSSLPTPEDIRARHASPAAPNPVSEKASKPLPNALSSLEVGSARSVTSLDPNRDYEIQVSRNGVQIPKLSRPLTPHKSLLVGKFSTSKAIFPDIDLRRKFASDQAEALCSRQQARIYWSHGQIQLLNIGQSPIVLPDGRHLAKDETHAWLPGEELILPGGLSLHLAVLGY